MKSLLDRFADGTPQVLTALPNRFKPWTPEVLSELRRLFLGGRSVKEIAQALGRTEEAVASRIRREVLSPPGTDPPDHSTPNPAPHSDK